MHDSVSKDVRSSSRERNISPFLVRAGTPRTGEDLLPGHYCEEQKMWVVETKHGTLPIINEQVLSQLVTKTYQRTESDDDTWPIGHSNLLQLVTKTDSIKEIDDNYLASQLLELVTKTSAQMETDDEHRMSYGFHS